MTTTEKNQLIAEFMNRETIYDIIDDNKYHGQITLARGITKEQIEGEISHFEDRYDITPVAKETTPDYHKDWNELIPVIRWVAIIEQPDFFGGVFQTTVETLEDSLWENNIKKAYDEVCEFIISYNKHKQ